MHTPYDPTTHGKRSTRGHKPSPVHEKITSAPEDGQWYLLDCEINETTVRKTASRLGAQLSKLETGRWIFRRPVPSTEV